MCLWMHACDYELTFIHIHSILCIYVSLRARAYIITRFNFNHEYKRMISNLYVHSSIKNGIYHVSEFIFARLFFFLVLEATVPN